MPSDSDLITTITHRDSATGGLRPDAVQSLPLTATFPEFFSTHRTTADVAAYLAGDPLPPSSPWNILARKREAVAMDNWTACDGLDPRVISYLQFDIQRGRLPWFSRGGRPESLSSSLKVKRKLVALEWLFGEPLGVAHLSLLQQQCFPLFNYVAQLGIVVEMNKNLRAWAPEAAHIPSPTPPEATASGRPIPPLPKYRSVAYDARARQIEALERKLEHIELMKVQREATLKINALMHAVGAPQAKSEANVLNAFLGADAPTERISRVEDAKLTIAGKALPDVKVEEVDEEVRYVKRVRIE